MYWWSQGTPKCMNVIKMLAAIQFHITEHTFIFIHKPIILIYISNGRFSFFQNSLHKHSNAVNLLETLKHQGLFVTSLSVLTAYQ
jgi:hypothetical protein